MKTVSPPILIVFNQCEPLLFTTTATALTINNCSVINSISNTHAYTHTHKQWERPTTTTKRSFITVISFKHTAYNKKSFFLFSRTLNFCTGFFFSKSRYLSICSENLFFLYSFYDFSSEWTNHHHSSIVNSRLKSVSYFFFVLEVKIRSIIAFYTSSSLLFFSMIWSFFLFFLI